jgi:hypothetical protein
VSNRELAGVLGLVSSIIVGLAVFGFAGGSTIIGIIMLLRGEDMSFFESGVFYGSVTLVTTVSVLGIYIARDE